MKRNVYIITFTGLLFGTLGAANAEEPKQNKPVIQKVCSESFSINNDLYGMSFNKRFWALRWPTKAEIEKKKVTYNNRRFLRAKLTTWLWVEEIMQSECVPSSEEVKLLALKGGTDYYDVLRLKYKVDSCVVQIMSIQSSLLVAIKDTNQLEPIDIDNMECVEKYVKGYIDRFFNYSDRLKSTSFGELVKIKGAVSGLHDRKLDQNGNWMSSVHWWTNGEVILFSFFKFNEGFDPFPPGMDKHWFGEEDKAIVKRFPLPTPKRFKPKDPVKKETVQEQSPNLQ